VTAGASSLSPARAFALVLLCFVGLFALSPYLGLTGAPRVFCAELVFVLLPVLSAIYAARLPRETLGVDRAAPLATLGAFVAGLGLFYLLAAVVEPAQSRVLPVPPSVAQSLQQLVTPPAPRPLAFDLVTFALLPAVAEELLFRGLLLASLRPRIGTVAAVVVSALAFAAFHFSPHALIAATLAGLALGAVRVWSGALLPAVALHVANNGAVLVATRAGIAEPPLRVWSVAAALAALAIGGLLAARRR